MLLTVRDEQARFRVEAPDDCEVRLDYQGTDYLIVPDPEDEATSFWLFDELLLEAARCGDFGLRLVWEVPLT